MAEHIASSIPNCGLINLCGSTNLSQLIGVISSARLLLSNETSAIHIAAATSTPSVCLLGGGHFGRFVPYPSSAPMPHPIPVYYSMPCFNCNWQCIHHLEPDTLHPALKRLLLIWPSAAEKPWQTHPLDFTPMSGLLITLLSIPANPRPHSCYCPEILIVLENLRYFFFWWSF